MFASRVSKDDNRSTFSFYRHTQPFFLGPFRISTNTFEGLTADLPPSDTTERGRLKWL